MKIYQVNGQWFVEAVAGIRNNDSNIGGGKLGPFEQKPEPVAKWRETENNSYGEGVSIFTRFRAGDSYFALQDYNWSAASGYSAVEYWEELIDDATPPVLGESFEWSDSGWVACEHPQTA